MLVLKRKINEAIMLGSDMEVFVVDIKGDTVKLGIKAPDSIGVFRKELYQEIQKQNIASSSQQLKDFDKVQDLLKKN